MKLTIPEETICKSFKNPKGLFIHSMKMHKSSPIALTTHSQLQMVWSPLMEDIIVRDTNIVQIQTVMMDHPQLRPPRYVLVQKWISNYKIQKVTVFQYNVKFFPKSNISRTIMV
jgi:hypothetical protein